MSVLDEFRHEARASTGWLESIVRDVTAEQAAWHPPGQANTIASTYAHIVRNFDEDISERFFGRALLSDGEWRGRTGLPPGPGVEWEAGVVIDWPALREYGRAMSAFMVEWVDALTEDDLRRRVQMGAMAGGVWDGIEVVRLTAGRHVWMHGGEIACLKGLQGLDGYVGFQTTNV